MWFDLQQVRYTAIHWETGTWHEVVMWVSLWKGPHVLRLVQEFMIAPTGAKSFKEVRDVLVERFIASSTAVSFQMFDVEPSANRH